MATRPWRGRTLGPEASVKWRHAQGGRCRQTLGGSGGEPGEDQRESLCLSGGRVRGWGERGRGHGTAATGMDEEERKSGSEAAMQQPSTFIYNLHSPRGGNTKHFQIQ